MSDPLDEWQLALTDMRALNDETEQLSQEHDDERHENERLVASRNADG